MWSLRGSSSSELTVCACSLWLRLCVSSVSKCAQRVHVHWSIAPLKSLQWSASTLGLWGVLHDCPRVFLSQFFGAIVDYSNNLIRCTLLFLFGSRGCILHIQVCLLGRRSRTTASLPLTSHSRRRSRWPLWGSPLLWQKCCPGPASMWSSLQTFLVLPAPPPVASCPFGVAISMTCVHSAQKRYCPTLWLGLCGISQVSRFLLSHVSHLCCLILRQRRQRKCEWIRKRIVVLGQTRHIQRSGSSGCLSKAAFGSQHGKLVVKPPLSDLLEWSLWR